MKRNQPGKSSSRQVHFLVDSRLLARIDRRAPVRSQFFVDAAREKLERLERSEMEDRMRAGFQAMAKESLAIAREFAPHVDEVADRYWGEW